MTIYSNRSEQMNNYWVDIDAMLKKPGVVGNASHPLLSGTYRRAVGAKLTFKFPFYGHMMTNLTIATGGFLYVGDQTHNWLAATQYIAPLMANFDTTLDGSSIVYADDGERFVVEWRKVQLREQHQAGSFTFQTSLFKNGSIAFVYKNVTDALILQQHFFFFCRIHRRRQHWAENNCKNQGKNMYCNAATDEEELEDDRYISKLECFVEVKYRSSTFSSTPASERPSSLDDVIPLNKERKTEKAKSEFCLFNSSIHVPFPWFLKHSQ
ncbi:hypothetical protein ANCCEY_11024 [Ancylostoma ceylanicum]|uniref:Uncharacterized protein n=1 Tax=Ancylostoma ceylanicum TaxID=53326 RepID=A0A0D6LFD4_9BILA|nr:hypothetical protein ANCCEY_11024 [Ancylostoma ceylanicum]